MTADEILAAMLAAIEAGDYNLAYQLQLQLDSLASNAGGGQQTTVPDGFVETHNLANALPTPCGDQCVQNAYWDLRGSIFGLATQVPRYWRMEFFVEDGSTLTDYLLDNITQREYAPWFKDVLLKRGVMRHRPIAGSDEFPDGYALAVQKVAPIEYSWGFWKQAIAAVDPLTEQVIGNGLNVAWFLYYGGEIPLDEFPQPDPEAPPGTPDPPPYIPAAIPDPITEPFTETDSNGGTGWRIAIIENTRVKATGGLPWTNSYAPLIEYELLTRGEVPFDEDTVSGRPRVFRTLDVNLYRPLNNYLNFPPHYLKLSPFYP